MVAARTADTITKPQCEVVVIDRDISRRQFMRKLRELEEYRIIFYVENRPGFTHGTDAMITEAAAMQEFQGGRLYHQQAFVEGDLDADAMEIINRGLEQQLFKDTTRIAQWIETVNELSKFEQYGLKRLCLVVVHALHHVEWLLSFLNRGPKRPAGFVFSGSTLMLTDTRFHEATRKTRKVIRFALKYEIPLLAMCYGMHLLSLEAFEQCVDWMTVPKGMTVAAESHVLREKDSNDCTTGLTPGQRLMDYGAKRINRLPHAKDDPVMNQVVRAYGQEVHFQALFAEYRALAALEEDERDKYPRTQAGKDFHCEGVKAKVRECGIPFEAILAYSRRLFWEETPTTRPKRRSPDVEQIIVEVMKAGPVAYGTQLHPEYPPELLYAMTFMPFVLNWFQQEKQNVDLIRRRLLQLINDESRSKYTAGEKIGFNWGKRVLGPNFAEYLFESERVTEDQKDAIIVDLDNERKKRKPPQGAPPAGDDSGTRTRPSARGRKAA